MNVDNSGMIRVPPEVIKHMMEKEIDQVPLPTPIPHMAVPIVGPGLREYKGSFTVEPQSVQSGRVDTVHVTIKAANREDAMERMRSWANHVNQGMICSRFQVCPSKTA